MIKESAVILFCLVLLSSLVVAQNKISIEPLKERYSGSEKIGFKVSLYDSQNNPISDEVLVVVNDSENINSIAKTITSNKPEEIDLGSNAPYGYWKITATYKDKNTNEIIEGKALFFVESDETASFELTGDNLIITNIGNTPYSKAIQILIGDTAGSKKIENLGVGEKISFRLIAPDGEYNIRITDGKTTISREKVALTGDAIGILDERLNQAASGITSGAGKGSIFRTSFAYIFVLVIFATAILLAVERKYKRKLGK